MKNFEEYLITESKEEEIFELNVKFTNLSENDLKKLQKLFTAMNYGGAVGASREIKVFVDGDGAFRAKIEMDKELDKEEAKKACEEYSNEKLNIGLGC